MNKQNPRHANAPGAGMNLVRLTHSGPGHVATTSTSMNMSIIRRSYFALGQEVDAFAQMFVLAFHDKMLVLEFAAIMLTLSLRDLLLRQTQTTGLDLHDQDLTILRDLRVEAALELRPQVGPNTLHKEPLSDCV